MNNHKRQFRSYLRHNIYYMKWKNPLDCLNRHSGSNSKRFPSARVKKKSHHQQQQQRAKSLGFDFSINPLISQCIVSVYIYMHSSEKPSRRGFVYPSRAHGSTSKIVISRDLSFALVLFLYYSPKAGPLSAVRDLAPRATLNHPRNRVHACRWLSRRGEWFFSPSSV